MAINPALLICAPVLQDYFVDNVNGAAMSAGVVTCYQDNSRTTLKNWYYQSGTPGNYTYITLDNPLTLSAVGTITDPNGNDTIPFFYPYDENDETLKQPYYITVVDSNGQGQFVRQNFPFISSQPQSNQVPSFNNIISNNVFYHNVGSLSVTNSTNVVIAPSQHDGYMASNNNDIRFVKNVTGANDTITFTAFGLGTTPFLPEPTPEYYLNFDCVGSEPGETTKCIQIPLSFHVKTLESVNATMTIWAQNVSGNTNNVLDFSILQFLGSNAIGTSPLTSIASITLSNTWIKYMINFTFPSAQGLSLGSTGDDALFLQIGLPLSVTCNINIAKPSIYLSETIPTNEFENYDQIDTIINSPRTGDIRTTLNNFSPFGWVPLTDKTICLANPNSIATVTRANVDTWNLYSLIWNSVGSTNAPIFDNMGNPAAYGANAAADFAANKQLSLTKQLGSALASVGLANSGGVTTWVLGQNFGEQQHTLTINEMPSHNHPGSFIGGSSSEAVGAFVERSDTNNANQTVTVAAQGGGIAHNITQPTTFYNMFMKL